MSMLLWWSLHYNSMITQPHCNYGLHIFEDLSTTISSLFVFAISCFSYATSPTLILIGNQSPMHNSNQPTYFVKRINLCTFIVSLRIVITYMTPLNTRFKQSPSLASRTHHFTLYSHVTHVTQLQLQNGLTLFAHVTLPIQPPSHSFLHKTLKLSYLTYKSIPYHSPRTCHIFKPHSLTLPLFLEYFAHVTPPLLHIEFTLLAHVTPQSCASLAHQITSH